MKIKTNSENETKKIAGMVAQKVINKEAPRLIALKGDLGGGKTTFVKGFADKLNMRRITSPTFVIMKKYSLLEKKWNFLYHIDCYRLSGPENLRQINFKEIREDKNSIIALEWPGKVSLDLSDWLKINFKFISKGKREISFSDDLRLKIIKN